MPRAVAASIFDSVNDGSIVVPTTYNKFISMKNNFKDIILTVAFRALAGLTRRICLSQASHFFSRLAEKHFTKQTKISDRFYGWLGAPIIYSAVNKTSEVRAEEEQKKYKEALIEKMRKEHGFTEQQGKSLEGDLDKTTGICSGASLYFISHCLEKAAKEKITLIEAAKSSEHQYSKGFPDKAVELFALCTLFGHERVDDRMWLPEQNERMVEDGLRAGRACAFPIKAGKEGAHSGILTRHNVHQLISEKDGIFFVGVKNNRAQGHAMAWIKLGKDCLLLDPNRGLIPVHASNAKTFFDKYMYDNGYGAVGIRECIPDIPANSAP